LPTKTTNDQNANFEETDFGEKRDKTNEAKIILQTQLARTFAEKMQADFENLQSQPGTKPKPRKDSQSKPPQTETQAKNLEVDFSDWIKPT
jgi:hypothetical protein